MPSPKLHVKSSIAVVLFWKEIGDKSQNGGLSIVNEGTGSGFTITLKMVGLLSQLYCVEIADILY